MAEQIVITEKSSQARDVRAAVGSRYGDVLAAEGHLLELEEPGDVAAEWKRWSAVLLRPPGLYPTRPAQGGNKAAKFAAIRAALRRVGRVWLATDCDREGQLIGQEILEYLHYRGDVMRVMFTAQDPQSIRDAFARARPNADYAPLYAAAVARRQADQIYNLSLTRTATVALGRSAAGVIGIGRVKTPTLAIVCERERAIREFVAVPYFDVIATAHVDGGSFVMRHTPKSPCLERARAEQIASTIEGYRGPLTVTVERRRQRPPRLHDLPSLQKLCAQRFGWTADKTLEIAQQLYDGQGKKIITYPRAEVRYLPESLAADVPRLVAGLRAGQRFATIPLPEAPVIRRGANGTFHDAGLIGASHHAIIPNVNTVASLREIWPRLSLNEKQLFDCIARAYLAAVMPDYRYLQTNVGVDANGYPLRATGRQDLDLGWRAAFASRTGWAGDSAAAQDGDVAPLPALTNGSIAELRDASVDDKVTRPPPRYNEGTLVEAMQNAWRFVADSALRERLKEARGIGTPATRAAIIDGLKRQHFLVTEGKHIVPTDAGMALHGLLERADPALVDPGVTARMEYQLDDILSGRQDVAGAIDAVCVVAARIIDVLAATPAQLPLPRRATTKANKASRPRKAARSGAISTGEKTLKKPSRSPRRHGQPGTRADADNQPKRRVTKRPGGQIAPATAAAERTTRLRIPYGNKDIALKLGARYRDGEWHAPPGIDLAPFRQRGWL